MFKVNEDLSLHVTRGDNVTFAVTATKDDKNYSFKAGDVARIKVTAKKACETVVLQKDFAVESASDSVTITLTETETRIGSTISKPVDYWYEIELNPFNDPQTIIGYDEDGPKVFRLYPEGRDLEDIVIEEEDIPYVDKELDMTSVRPVENQAIARQFAIIDAELDEVKEDVNYNTSSINNVKSTLANHTANKSNPHGVTAEQIGARPSTWTPTAQEVGARPNTWTPTAEEVKARPDTWMPTASQVGARPNTWTPTAEEVGAVTVAQVNTIIDDKVVPMIDAKSTHTSAVYELSSSGWTNNAQTISVGGLSTDDTVIASPSPESHEAYCEAGVYCYSQANGTLTFKCTDVPATTLKVNVILLGVSGAGGGVAYPDAEGGSF